jgi:hypothetical protein
MPFGMEEDRNAEEETQARRDRREAAAGRRFGISRTEPGRRRSLDRRDRGHVLSLATGVLKTDQVKRLKDLETENTRLRKAISDLTLDKLILQEAAKGNF